MLDITATEFYNNWRRQLDNKLCVRCGEWRPKAEFASVTRFAVCDTCKAEKERERLARYRNKKRGNITPRPDP